MVLCWLPHHPYLIILSDIHYYYTDAVSTVEGVVIIAAGSAGGGLTVLLLLLVAVTTITTACLKFKTNDVEYNSKTSTEGDIVTNTNAAYKRTATTDTELEVMYDTVTNPIESTTEIQQSIKIRES